MDVTGSRFFPPGGVGGGRGIARWRPQDFRRNSGKTLWFSRRLHTGKTHVARYLGAQDASQISRVEDWPQGRFSVAINPAVHVFSVMAGLFSLRGWPPR
jgi:hypothetical protein